MPGAYSHDLRDRVLAAAHAGLTRASRGPHAGLTRASRGPHAGLTQDAVAARFAVGESTVRQWLRRERLAGQTTAHPNRDTAAEARCRGRHGAARW
jgi:hypothetical protein